MIAPVLVQEPAARPRSPAGWKKLECSAMHKDHSTQRIKRLGPGSNAVFGRGPREPPLQPATAQENISAPPRENWAIETRRCGPSENDSRDRSRCAGTTSSHRD